MKCNLKEKALTLFRKKQEKKEDKIIKDFNKKFGCRIDLRDVKLKHGIVIFEFDDFEIWGNSSEGKPYFHFHHDKYDRIPFAEVKNIDRLGNLINCFCDK